MWPIIITGFIFFLFFIFNPQTNYYTPKWYAVVQIGVTYLCIQIYHVTSLPIALLFLYSLTSVTYFSQCHFSHFNIKFEQLSMPFSGRLAKTLAAGVGLCLIMVHIEMVHIEYFIKASPFILFVGNLFTLTPEKYRKFTVCKAIHFPMCRPKVTEKNAHYFSNPTYWGYGSNPSVASTFYSLLAPFTLFNLHTSKFYFYFTIITLVMTLASILYMKASSGFGGFMAAMFTYLFYEINYYVLIPIVLFGISIYFLNKYHFKGGLFKLSGRDDIIKFAYKHLIPRKGFLSIGNGLGSTTFLMPLAQLRAKKKEKPTTEPMKQLYTFLHCDLLQFAFDGGIIGIILLIIAYGEVTYLAYGIPALMAFLAAFTVNAITNFPCHIADQSLLVILALRLLYVS